MHPLATGRGAPRVVAICRPVPVAAPHPSFELTRNWFHCSSRRNLVQSPWWPRDFGRLMTGPYRGGQVVRPGRLFMGAGGGSPSRITLVRKRRAVPMSMPKRASARLTQSYPYSTSKSKPDALNPVDLGKSGVRTQRARCHIQPCHLLPNQGAAAPSRSPDRDVARGCDTRRSRGPADPSRDVRWQQGWVSVTHSREVRPAGHREGSNQYHSFHLSLPASPRHIHHLTVSCHSLPQYNRKAVRTA